MAGQWEEKGLHQGPFRLSDHQGASFAFLGLKMESVNVFLGLFCCMYTHTHTRARKKTDKQAQEEELREAPTVLCAGL